MFVAPSFWGDAKFAAKYAALIGIRYVYAFFIFLFANLQESTKGNFGEVAFAYLCAKGNFPGVLDNDTGTPRNFLVRRRETHLSVFVTKYHDKIYDSARSP